MKQGSGNEPLALVDHPSYDTERLYSMNLRTKAGTVFNFDGISIEALLQRIEAAAPYGIGTIVITENEAMPPDPPSFG